MAIRIPDKRKKPIRELVTMSPAVRARFIEAVRSAEAIIDPSELISHVVEKTGIDEPTVRPIISMLVSMYTASDGSPVEFSEQVAESAQDALGDDRQELGDWGLFAQDLAKLLSCDKSLGIIAKIQDVRQEYGRLFCSARVLSDIRPVFGSDPTAAPLAAAITHTLRITYHEREDHKEFHCALDAADLRQLRDLVERAISKEAAIRVEIDKTAMRFFEPGAE